ncbi:hypothetical protein [Cellulomonas soli]
MNDGLVSGETGSTETFAAGTLPPWIVAVYPNSAVSEPIGGNRVMVNESFVPPRPSPAMFASSELTAVNVEGSVVVS